MAEGKDKKYAAILDPDAVLRHYEQPHVLEAILSISMGKEVVGSYGGTGYGKRPDMLQYPSDILEQVKRGVTSFHFSEETWRNPMMLVPGMPEAELHALRMGWDLIIDIDCTFIEYSKIAAHLLIQALQHLGIQSVTCKFSGNHGFHIAVPFEAFPAEVNGRSVSELFPDGARAIAEYLKEVIEPVAGSEYSLASHIIDYERKANGLPADATEDVVLPFIQEKSGLSFEELTTSRQTPEGSFRRFNALNILEIDTILISSRHLLRHVYSINEKSGLVSIPINPEKVLSFDREIAKLENGIKSRFGFLMREGVRPEEATKLFVQAYDYRQSLKPKDLAPHVAKKREYIPLEGKVPEELFPPCIRGISAGIKDGRKRAMFALVNFLQSMGWQYEDIEAYLVAWNKRNPEPLRDIYLRSQLHAIRKGKPILPPNCNNKAYYIGIGVCNPDKMCSTIRNPANYSLKKAFIARKQEEAAQKPARAVLTEEQKAARREFRKKKKAEQVVKTE